MHYFNNDVCSSNTTQYENLIKSILRILVSINCTITTTNLVNTYGKNKLNNCFSWFLVRNAAHTYVYVGVKISLGELRVDWRIIFKWALT
jgi:hypothetical protein